MHKAQQVKLVDWKTGNVRKIWRKLKWGEPSQLVALTMKTPCKADLATLQLPAVEMVEGHMGHISSRRVVNQQNALERGWEKRNKHRGLSLMTL